MFFGQFVHINSNIEVGFSIVDVGEGDFALYNSLTAYVRHLYVCQVGGQGLHVRPDTHQLKNILYPLVVYILSMGKVFSHPSLLVLLPGSFSGHRIFCFYPSGTR